MHPTRIFKSPEDILKAWEEYKEQLKEDANEWTKVQYVGKNGEKRTDALKLPYTMEGFNVFCYKNYGTVHQYFENKDALYSDFVGVCSHIRETIRANQITGGLLGVFNPSITQRLNGLSDKKEIDLKGELNIPNIPDIGNRK